MAIGETSYTGTFTESDTCNPPSGAVATVVALSNASGTATYAVTPQGAGTCTITVTDTSGHGVAIPVSVSTAAISVQ